MLTRIPDDLLQPDDRLEAPVEAAGLGDVHFHDLRHTGNTFAAASGAGIKDLG